MNEQEQQLVEQFMAARKDSAKREQVESFLALLLGHRDVGPLVALFTEARGDKAREEVVVKFLRELLAALGHDRIQSLQKRVEELETQVRLLKDVPSELKRLETLPARVDALDKLGPRVDNLDKLGPRVDNLDKLPARVNTLDQLVPRVDNLDNLKLDKLAPRLEKLETSVNGPSMVKLALDDLERATAFRLALTRVLKLNGNALPDSFDPTAEFDIKNTEKRRPYVAFTSIAGLLESRGFDSPYVRDPRIEDLASRLKAIGLVGECSREFSRAQMLSLDGLRRPPHALSGDDSPEVLDWIREARAEAYAVGGVLDKPKGLLLEIQKKGQSDWTAATPADLKATSGSEDDRFRLRALTDEGFLRAREFDAQVTRATADYSRNQPLYERTFLLQLGRRDLAANGHQEIKA